VIPLSATACIAESAMTGDAGGGGGAAMTDGDVVEFAFNLDLKENLCFGIYFAFCSSIVLDNSFNCYSQALTAGKRAS
jgi:hypothetical protein